jgi:hypothetical protein
VIGRSLALELSLAYNQQRHLYAISRRYTYQDVQRWEVGLEFRAPPAPLLFRLSRARAISAIHVSASAKKFTGSSMRVAFAVLRLMTSL